ncbi:unnamed protein product, partial [Sphagnum compactum]
MFADGCVDGVFSSHTLEHFTREQTAPILEEWARVIKVGGYMVLYLPSANLYPKMGENGANPDHKQDIYPGDIEAIFARGIGKQADGTYHAWTMLECEERGETNEYSLYYVFRKEDEKCIDGSTIYDKRWQRNPDGKKRALVIRYGAIGDMLQVSSVFPGLKKQGYHLTLMCKDTSYALVKHDPNIDDFILQAQDFVPNQELGSYWASIAPRYDKVINLCESIEGGLLTLPGRLQHQYPDEARRKLFGTVNYLERLHDIAGVPYDFASRFYATGEEHEWVSKTKWRMSKGAPIVVWCINGSSAHKVYPWVHIVAAWLVERTNAHIVLMADAGVGVELQGGVMEALQQNSVDTSRIHPTAGDSDWHIRRSLMFAERSSVLVGPETGPLNSAALAATKKVIYLSHSSAENLTKHWHNCITLLPDTEKCPCYPCHRLHSSWEHCHQSAETSAALCASAVTPESVFAAIMKQLGAQ